MYPARIESEIDMGRRITHIHFFSSKSFSIAKRVSGKNASECPTFPYSPQTVKNAEKEKAMAPKQDARADNLICLKYR